MTLLQFLRLIAPELTEQLAMLSIYGSIAAALLTCFFGFRLRQIWYSLLVFATGALLGYCAGRLFVPDRPWLCVLIGLGVGAVTAAFTFRLYQAVVFMLVFCCVFAMVGEVLGDLHPLLSVICAVALGVIAGILAARFQYHAVIILTSVTGGWRAASLLRRCARAMTPETMLMLAGALMAAGMIFQFVSTRKHK